MCRAPRSLARRIAGVKPLIRQNFTHVRSCVVFRKIALKKQKTLFQIMTIYLRLSPADEAVYQFLDKKRAEGKPYYVYMTAGANKFLRIYYARVKECMAKLDAPAEAAPEDN